MERLFSIHLCCSEGPNFIKITRVCQPCQGFLSYGSRLQQRSLDLSSICRFVVLHQSVLDVVSVQRQGSLSYTDALFSYIVVVVVVVIMFVTVKNYCVL